MLMIPSDVRREEEIDKIIATYEYMLKLKIISQEECDRELRPLIEEKQNMLDRQSALNGVEPSPRKLSMEKINSFVDSDMPLFKKEG